jgi:hypothetical protein
MVMEAVSEGSGVPYSPAEEAPDPVAVVGPECKARGLLVPSLSAPGCVNPCPVAFIIQSEQGRNISPEKLASINKEIAPECRIKAYLTKLIGDRLSTGRS